MKVPALAFKPGFDVDRCDLGGASRGSAGGGASRGSAGGGASRGSA